MTYRRTLTIRLFLALAALAQFHLRPAILFAAATEKNCAVCGMKTTTDAKTGFNSVKDGKPVYFCSFACAHRFHGSGAHKDAPLFAHDYKSGAEIDANKAYYLVKSKSIAKEIDFDMPPTVVAFSTEQAAKETQSRVKDGEVVKGFEAVVKAYK